MKFKDKKREYGHFFEQLELSIKYIYKIYPSDTKMLRDSDW